MKGTEDISRKRLISMIYFPEKRDEEQEGVVEHLESRLKRRRITDLEFLKTIETLTQQVSANAAEKQDTTVDNRSKGYRINKGTFGLDDFYVVKSLFACYSSNRVHSFLMKNYFAYNYWRLAVR